MNDMPLVTSTTLFALVTACVLTSMSTTALAACKTTLRGELVPNDSPKLLFQAVPQELLFFSLDEIIEENGHKVTTRFQSFRIQNSNMTFPTPFELEVDSPRDCPKQVELSVVGSDHDGFHHEFPLRGWKRINLENDEFERVIVYPPTF